MKVKAPLDPGFQPAVLANRAHRQKARTPLVIAVEREAGKVSRYETVVNPDAPDALRYVERLVKFLLWARGGWKVSIGGPRALCQQVQARAFDAELMGRAYEKKFVIEVMEEKEVPAASEYSTALGGNLDGYRIGFDLGASDYKVAAVKNGEVVYADEFPWNPKDEPDPQYHYRHLNEGLKKAAAHLPRVDAIGGSSAGMIIGNKIMVASLFRGVPLSKFDEAKNIFLRIRDEWKVPLEVANDGDVTALAGGMSLQAKGVLGIALGSSQAAGYLDAQGRMTSWISELAFAPVDYNPEAPADEWSGDRGVGALYFSQQAVNKLLPASGIAVPEEMGLPERLKEVQALMAKDDARARQIYETIGVYLGYSIPHYADFYSLEHLLILGRVTTGAGGDIILAKAREVLQTEFPELAGKVALHTPDEKSKRVGQAVAAASLPALEKRA